MLSNLWRSLSKHSDGSSSCDSIIGRIIVCIKTRVPVIVGVAAHISDGTGPWDSSLVSVTWAACCSPVESQTSRPVELCMLRSRRHNLCYILELDSHAIKELGMLAEYTLVIMGRLVPSIRQIIRLSHSFVRSKRFKNEKEINYPRFWMKGVVCLVLTLPWLWLEWCERFPGLVIPTPVPRLFPFAP